jgi:predicted AAA+ superfamily ATPase
MVHNFALAKALMRQHITRSTFLIPFTGIEDSSWQILLHFYAVNKTQEFTLFELSNALEIEPHQLRRYLNVLGNAGYVRSRSNNNGNFVLSDPARQAMDELMPKLAQELLSSLDI